MTPSADMIWVANLSIGLSRSSTDGASPMDPLLMPLKTKYTVRIPAMNASQNPRIIRFTVLLITLYRKHTKIAQKPHIRNTLRAKFGILWKVMNTTSHSWYFLSNFVLPNKL